VTRDVRIDACGGGRGHAGRGFAATLVAILLLLGFVPAALAQVSVTNPFGAPAKTETAAPAEDTATAEDAATVEADVKAAREALIRVLQDDTRRQRLIEELGRLDPAAAPATPAAPTAAPAGAVAAPTAENEMLQKVAELSREVRGDALDILTRTWTSLLNLQTLVDGSVELDWSKLWERYDNTVLLIGIAILLTIVLRLAIRPLLGWLDRLATRPSAAARISAIAGGVLAEAVPVVVTFIALVVTALVVEGGPDIDLSERDFLAAFIVTQFFRLVVRVVLRPGHDNLRFVPFSRRLRAYWTSRLSALIGVVGYGLIFVVPMISRTTSFRLGIGLRTAIVIVATLVAIGLVLRHRAEVRRELVDASNSAHSKTVAKVLVRLSRIWHVLVVLYILTGFVIWSTRPTDALHFMLAATFWSVTAVVVGALASRVLRNLGHDGLVVSDGMRAALPTFEKRLNLFVPTLAAVLRFAIGVVVVGVILQVWGLIDVQDWFDNREGSVLVRRITTAFLMLVVLIAGWLALTSWIEYQLNPTLGRAATARMRTLFALLRNAVTILFAVIGTMLLLSELGIDIAPLIAGAGVIGLAIGFGSQKLVQDIITGAFIQFENAMNEGDVVTVAGISGVVEHLTIRSVGLRDLSGVYHVVPFSAVEAVSNAMRDFSFHVAEIGVAYRENVEEVKRLMFVAFERLMETEHGAFVLEPLDMQGVIAMGDNSVVIRARIKTQPGKQWGAGRAYTEIVKAVFDEHGIEIPFPQRTLWFGEQKDGAAPPLRFMGDVVERGEPATAGAKPAAAPAGPAHGPSRADLPPSETIDVPESPDDER